MLSGQRLLDKVRVTSQKLTAISHIHRLAILLLLSRETLKPREISERTKLPAALVAHHVRILLGWGFIRKEKYGKIVLYTVTEGALEKFVKELVELVNGVSH